MIRQVTRLVAIDEKIPILPQTLSFNERSDAYAMWAKMSIKMLKKVIPAEAMPEGKTVEDLFERPNIYRMSNTQNIIDVCITTVGVCYVKVVTEDGGLLMYIETRPSILH